MSKVRTYDCTNGKAQHCYGCYTMTEDKNGNGDWVRKEDYDAALAENETLKRALSNSVSPHAYNCRWVKHKTEIKMVFVGHCTCGLDAALAAVEGGTWSTPQLTPQSVLKDYTARECDETGQLYDVVYVDGQMRTRTLVANGEEKT